MLHSLQYTTLGYSPILAFTVSVSESWYMVAYWQGAVPNAYLLSGQDYGNCENILPKLPTL